MGLLISVSTLLMVQKMSLCVRVKCCPPQRLCIQRSRPHPVLPPSLAHLSTYHHDHPAPHISWDHQAVEKGYFASASTALLASPMVAVMGGACRCQHIVTSAVPWRTLRLGLRITNFAISSLLPYMGTPPPSVVVTWKHAVMCVSRAALTKHVSSLELWFQWHMHCTGLGHKALKPSLSEKYLGEIGAQG